MFWRVRRWWDWNKPVVYRDGKHWHDVQQQRLEYGKEVAEATWRAAQEALEEKHGKRRR